MSGSVGQRADVGVATCRAFDFAGSPGNTFDLREAEGAESVESLLLAKDALLEKSTVIIVNSREARGMLAFSILAGAVRLLVLSRLRALYAISFDISTLLNMTTEDDERVQLSAMLETGRASTVSLEVALEICERAL